MKKMLVMLLVLFCLGGCGDAPAASSQPPSLTQPLYSFTSYALPTPKSNPIALVVGPDDAIWFTELEAGKIGRLAPTGTVTEVTSPHPDFGPGKSWHSTLLCYQQSPW